MTAIGTVGFSFAGAYGPIKEEHYENPNRKAYIGFGQRTGYD